MSAFQIYLIMQMDSFVTLGTILGVLACVGCVIIHMFAYIELDNDEKAQAKALHAGKRVAIFAAASVFVAALLPSSRTMAVMVILPKLMNNEAIQTEAKEIYDLAKEGLKRLVGHEEKK